ncbi:MAG: HPF/RaiA family ribosome-associated protein, partial [Acidimicrobiia bacterium]|nr:HPF/RaiA family ribosome-associated protein [Acidimicrobiia bacterium]
YRVDGVPKEDYFVVERGAICDHWIDSTPDLVVEGEDVPAAGGLVEVVRDSAVPDRSVTYAEGKLLQQAERSGRPVRFARVKLALAHNPTNSRPALVEATLETDRFLVRAQASAAELNEAVDLVMDKLTSRIEQQHDRRRHWHGGTEPIPGSWRHGNLRRETSNHFERPQQEREVVRHKSFAPDKLALDEAIWDMALLDYDFFLFVESTTGEDALLERDLGGGLFLRFRDGRDPGSLLDEFDDVAPSIVAVPELSVAEAIALLDAGGGDHLQFFTNRSTGRGNVLYRRFDGHYGLITPPA